MWCNNIKSANKVQLSSHMTRHYGMSLHSDLVFVWLRVIWVCLDGCREVSGVKVLGRSMSTFLTSYPTCRTVLDIIFVMKER